MNIQTTEIQVTLQSKNLDCLMYADDMVIFSTSPEGLQNKLNSLEKYCADRGMKVNIKKTKKNYHFQ